MMYSIVVCWQKFETATFGGVAFCHPKLERTKSRDQKYVLYQFLQLGQTVLKYCGMLAILKKQCLLVLLLVILNLKEQSPPDQKNVLYQLLQLGQSSFDRIVVCWPS